MFFELACWGQPHFACDFVLHNLFGIVSLLTAFRTRTWTLHTPMPPPTHLPYLWFRWVFSLFFCAEHFLYRPYTTGAHTAHQWHEGRSQGDCEDNSVSRLFYCFMLKVLCAGLTPVPAGHMCSRVLERQWRMGTQCNGNAPTPQPTQQDNRWQQVAAGWALAPPSPYTHKAWHRYG